MGGGGSAGFAALPHPVVFPQNPALN